MKRYLIFTVVAVALIAGLSSCNNDNSLQELEDEEMKILEDYMSVNYPNATPTASGLYYIETHDAGKDSLIGSGDEVQIYYSGKLLSNGFVFDFNVDSLGRYYEPLKFVVGSGAVISGMDEGMTYMKVGDKATLVIPSRLGYKAVNDYERNIPKFSTLIFDVEIYKHTLLENR